jgi:hypothetical protein
MLKHLKNRVVNKVKKKIGSPSHGESPSSDAPSANTPANTEPLASTDVTAHLTDLAGGPPSAVKESSSNLDSATLLPDPASMKTEFSDASSDLNSAPALDTFSSTISAGELRRKAYEDIVFDPSDVGAKSNVRSVTFQSFKTVLTAIREAADAFPPLKSVAGGILGLMDIVEVRDFKHFPCNHL